MDPVVKAPLGLVPRRIHDMNRMDAITAAMERYLAAGMRVPEVWLQEQVELLRRYMPGVKDNE